MRVAEDPAWIKHSNSKTIMWAYVKHVALEHWRATGAPTGAERGSRGPASEGEGGPLRCPRAYPPGKAGGSSREPAPS
jgi:hypothetical protein